MPLTSAQLTVPVKSTAAHRTIQLKYKRILNTLAETLRRLQALREFGALLTAAAAAAVLLHCDG